MEPKIEYFGGVLAAAFLALIVVTLAMNRSAKGAKPNRGMPPIIALEFAENADDIATITDKNPDVQNGLNRALWIDTVFFIPLYANIFLLLSYLLALRADYLSRFAVVAATCAIIAAVADLSENYLTRQAMNRGDAWAFANLAGTAYVKWIAVFAAVAALSTIFWQNCPPLFFAMILAALLGFAGLLPRLRLLMPLAPVILLLALALMSLSFIFEAHHFKNAFAFTKHVFKIG